MPESKIQPHNITKPIQLLAVWFVGLIALVGVLLTAAAKISQPPWVCPLLVIAAIFLIPLFIFLIFLMQTKFRTQSLDDQHYAEWLERQEQMINGLA